MGDGFSFSCFSFCYFFLLLLLALFQLCLSDTNPSAMLCMDDERQALLRFKHGLIDDAGRLASWIQGEKSDCCKWVGIVCDNMYSPITYEECLKQKLRGDLSLSLLDLKQLKHLDLSDNDFGGKQVPMFMGSLRNLRYLNLSRSRFGGEIPPQLGNLSELRVLGLGNFHQNYQSHFDGTHDYESYSMMNIQWLSGLRLLRHLDLSGLNHSKAIDWLRVINTLPSLVELHLSNTQLMHIHPQVASFNLTSLSLLDLSRNDFSKSLVPRWIFSITSLVSLDLSWCGFRGRIPSSSDGFHNMTALELLHVRGNSFMNSSLVLKGLSSSSTSRRLMSLDIRDCGISSSVLDSLCWIIRVCLRVTGRCVIGSLFNGLRVKD